MQPLSRSAPPPPRRQEILEAAEDLFAERGFAGTGLREIAARVGIQAPALFKHFSGKKELYNSVLLENFVGLTAALETNLDGVGSYRQRLEQTLDAFIDFVAGHPNFPRILLRQILDHPKEVEDYTEEHGREIYRRVERFLLAGQEAGELRQASPAHVLVGLAGAINFIFTASGAFTPLGSIDLGNPEAIARCKHEIRNLARGVLFADGEVSSPEPAPAGDAPESRRRERLPRQRSTAIRAPARRSPASS